MLHHLGRSGSTTLREGGSRACRYFIGTEVPKAQQQFAFVARY